MAGFHGLGMRTGDNIPVGSIFKTGKFGRMFPHLAPLQVPDAGLIALGDAMMEGKNGAVGPNDPAGDNASIPAGFTYLGQFIDHDITFDTTGIPEVLVDPQAIHNFRTPKLDLDCLYGLGPAAQPFMYQRADPDKFLIGTNRPTPDQNGTNIPEKPNDLPRGADGFALIGDPRNDENLIVAQLHLAFLKFHNKVVDKLKSEGVLASEVFSQARRLVTWHYQWTVLNDFLRRLIDPAVLDDVLKNGRNFYRFIDEPFIPAEFSVAAYRLGHSMVREEYDYNRVFNPHPGATARGTLDLLFQFTGLSGPNSGPFKMPVPTNWIIDWRRFFQGLPAAPGAPTSFNFSRKLDPFAAPALHNLPNVGGEKRLPVRNLLRGSRVGLPSGQAVAAEIGVTALTPAQIAKGPDGAVAKAHGFDQRTPLWYYVLKKAQVKGKSERLGPVGSRILAEVFVGMLRGDNGSFLAAAPEWMPTLGKTAGSFSMADLLLFVDDLNPIGD
ncbi:MAG: peroxidase family protein [Planctomycetaceae bacterium]